MRAADAANRSFLTGEIRDAAEKLRKTADKLDRIANWEVCNNEELAVEAVDVCCDMVRDLGLHKIVRFGR